MRVLLDTHSVLWFLTGNEKLSTTAQEVMIDFENELVLSIASLWEIAIKVSLGKLELERPFEELFPSQLREHEIELLHMMVPHLVKVASLPFHHRDPFDRVIIAQSLAEGLPVITADPAFRSYGVTIIW
jgi:PIN domain nuclease of toxin-antitoxin system